MFAQLTSNIKEFAGKLASGTPFTQDAQVDLHANLIYFWAVWQVKFTQDAQ